MTMRTVTMEAGAHDALLAKLAVERKRAGDALRLIIQNEERGWKGIPTQDRLRQEERLPQLRMQISQLDSWIEPLVTAADITA